MRTRARFTDVAPDAGHYESFYLKATRPGGGQGLWIRHTVHQRPGEPATASLWLTFFDATADSGPRAVKSTVPASELSAPEDAFIRIADATLAPGRATGQISSPELEASWDLSFSDGAEPFHHLPYERLYRTRLPKTKFLSPYPASQFVGELRIGGERVELAGWPGMIGHNWGTEHAERWVWLQAPELGGREGDYLDLAAGRIKIGRWTTPWVANGQIVLEGEALRIGGFDRAYGTEFGEKPDSCDFVLPGKKVRVLGKVIAPRKDMVAWVYADPKGPEHHTLNCSISDMELTIERPGHSAATIEVSGAAAYEFGSRDFQHGIPLQPYPDG
jgi:hypothetical protein